MNIKLIFYIIIIFYKKLNLHRNIDFTFNIKK